MRLRYKVVTYHFGEDQSSQQSLERHYRELMEDLLRPGQQHASTRHAVQWRPPSDIHETPEAILVKMELAGISEDDLEVTLYEDALVVTGRRDDDLVHDDSVYYHEAQIRYGPFRAEILLPRPVRREGVEARYENGFLRVTLPIAAPSQSTETPHRLRRGERSGNASQPLQAGGPLSTTVQATPAQTSEGSELTHTWSNAIQQGPSSGALARGGVRDA
jgi:HSP20 family protein